MPRSLVVVGAGPGVGASLARRFAREGYAVGLVARSADTLRRLSEELQASGVTARWAVADITDTPALTTAVQGLAQGLGGIDVLHFNPSVFRARNPLELTAEEMLADVHVGVAALLTAVQAAKPMLRRGARITVTGSMAADRPSAAAPSLGVQKAALRNLVLSLDQALAPEGIRAMSLTVNGTLARGTDFDPDRVADAIFAAVATSEEEWLPEVPFNRR